MERKLQQFLDVNHVGYQRIEHAPTFTALATAHSAHVAEKELAKTVMLEVDDVFVMAAVPATHNVNLSQVRTYLGAESVKLAQEYEFEDLFEDCEPGAMPPLGNLFGLRVIVADELTEDEQIAFNAGAHDELVRMAYADFARLVKPLVARISQPRASMDY